MKGASKSFSGSMPGGACLGGMEGSVVEKRRIRVCIYLRTASSGNLLKNGCKASCFYEVPIRCLVSYQEVVLSAFQLL